MPTVKFYTFGCKVNQYETQLMREQFLNSGFREAVNNLPSDFYVINTCTVTHKADSDSLGLIASLSRKNTQAKIIVTGCLTEFDEDKIKNIDKKIIIVKNEEKERILDHPSLKSYRKIEYKNCISYFKGHTRAFLKIQDGCDNHCSYCKVAKVRGRSKSRDLNEIIKEANQLVNNGIKEIVLCGVCLGSYGKDLNPKIDLVKVIEVLEKMDRLLRIRLSSIEAKDISEELIEKFCQSEKLCKHLHIPVQSGDDGILEKMNRNYSSVDYLNLIKRIRSRIPEIAITTDVLVGFPGETEIAFRNTINLIKEILPLRVHIFPFSPREKTPAYNFKDRVNPIIIKERIQRLKSISKVCELTYKKQFLNKDMPVLIECQSKDPLIWKGLTDNYLKILVKSNQNLKNQIVYLRLKSVIDDYILADFC